MITIGNYTYSKKVEETLKRAKNSEDFSLMYERRAREYMLAERLKIDLALEVHIIDLALEVHIYDGPKSFEVTIIGKWHKTYTKEEFYAGRAEFVEQVMLDYTFGVNVS